MEQRFNLTRSIIEDVDRILKGGLGKAKEQEQPQAISEEIEEIAEKLVGGQKNIDANKNGKIDADDFKKLRKEEAEQIEELANSTLKNYIKKSRKASDKAWEKSEKEEDKAMSTDGEKYPEKQKKHQDAANAANDTYNKRQDGLKMAKKKLGIKDNRPSWMGEEVEDLEEGRGKKGRERHQETEDEWGDESKGKKKFKPAKKQKAAAWDESYDYYVVSEEFGVGEILEVSEDFASVVFEGRIEEISLDDIFVEEIEQLDELSKDTLKSYQSKADAQVKGSVKRGKPSSATVAMRAKRGSGMANAKAKLEAIYKKEYAEHDANMKKMSGKLDDHFMKEHSKVLAKHGYTQHHSHDDGTTYTKKHDNGHVSMIHVKHNESNSFGGSKHEARAVNSKGTSWSSHRAHSGVYDQRDHDKHMLHMMPKFEQHVIDVSEHTDRPGNW